MPDKNAKKNKEIGGIPKKKMYVYNAAQTRERNMLKALKTLLNGRLPGRWHFLTVLVLGSSSTIVSAGEYVVSMSGGTADGVPYIGTSGTRGYTPPIFIQTSPLNINYSGTITTTFQWVTDDPISDPAPEEVIVVENSFVRLNYYGPQGAFSISDGFGETRLVGPWSGSELNTNRITVRGGAQFTTTCEPKIVGFSSAFGTLMPQLNYSVSVIVPKISLANTINVGGKKYVSLGKRLRASISYSGAVYGVTDNGIGWDVGGNADAVLNYVVNSGASSSYYTPFTDPGTKEASWFYVKGVGTDGQPKVKNITASITYAYQGATAHCTARAQVSLCGLKKISDTPINNTLGHYVTISSTIRTLSGDPTAPLPYAVSFNPAPKWAYPSVNGVQIAAGSLETVQKVLLDSSYHTPLGFDMTLGTTNGTYMLDTSYPYGGASFDDTPEYSFLANAAKSAFYHFNAKTYCTYRPDGDTADSIPVTYGKVSWKWSDDNKAPWTTPTGVWGCDSILLPGFDCPPTWDAKFN